MQPEEKALLGSHTQSSRSSKRKTKNLEKSKKPPKKKNIASQIQAKNAKKDKSARKPAKGESKMGKLSPKTPKSYSGGRAGSEGSDDSSSDASDEIIVFETPENQSYERRVIIGHLSRVGFREQFWSNKISSYFVMLAFLLTNDNVTYFYFYVHSFGMCWTIPFVICMLLIGFPLAYLEMALGQYTSTGVFLVFARMAPGFSVRAAMEYSKLSKKLQGSHNLITFSKLLSTCLRK